MINRPAKNIVSNVGRFLFVLILFISIFSSFGSKLSAVDYPKLVNRSLTIDDVSPGITTDYTISFQLPYVDIVGSMRLTICANGNDIDLPCSEPVGDFSSAVLTSQTSIAGYSISSQSANEILLTRTPANAGTFQATYVLSGVVNPVAAEDALYVRIQIYPSGDGTGTLNFGSSVVSAITNPIVITSIVPPILFFCAALSIDMWCQNTNGNQINYGTLSSVTGNNANSQFGVATNATGGYVVTINGSTMTSGTRTIAALNAPNSFTTGVPQFGLNLRANTLPAIGADPVGLGIGTVDADYNTPDLYQYIDGDLIASAVTGTLFDIFTVTYIVNVPPDQAAGVYTTTIAYICTAAF
jgi:hypothetical protein